MRQTKCEKAANLLLSREYFLAPPVRKRELQVKNTHLKMVSYLHYAQRVHHCFYCNN